MVSALTRRAPLARRSAALGCSAGSGLGRHQRVPTSSTARSPKRRGRAAAQLDRGGPGLRASLPPPDSRASPPHLRAAVPGAAARPRAVVTASAGAAPACCVWRPGLPAGRPPPLPRRSRPGRNPRGLRAESLALRADPAQQGRRPPNRRRRNPRERRDVDRLAANGRGHRKGVEGCETYGKRRAGPTGGRFGGRRRPGPRRQAGRPTPRARRGASPSSKAPRAVAGSAGARRLGSNEVRRHGRHQQHAAARERNGRQRPPRPPPGSSARRRASASRAGPNRSAAPPQRRAIATLRRLHQLGQRGGNRPVRGFERRPGCPARAPRRGQPVRP